MNRRLRLYGGFDTFCACIANISMHMNNSNKYEIS